MPVQHPVLKVIGPFFYQSRSIKKQNTFSYGPIIHSISAFPIALSQALLSCPKTPSYSPELLVEQVTTWAGALPQVSLCWSPACAIQITIELFLQPFLKSDVAKWSLSAQPKCLQMYLRCLFDVHRSFRSFVPNSVLIAENQMVSSKAKQRGKRRQFHAPLQ